LQEPKARDSSLKGGTQSEVTSRTNEFEDKSRLISFVRLAKCALEMTPFREFP